MEKNILCNPMNLDYRYQETIDYGGKKNVFREAADPTIVFYRGKYLLFASMSAGFWWSDDLSSWKFIEKKELPIYDYAPDVREIEGKLYFCASRNRENCSIFCVEDPFTEDFVEVIELFPFFDPHLFYDDGRVYLYWGCSNKNPIYGLELDSNSFQPIMELKELIKCDTQDHGWERTGVNNVPDWYEDELAKIIADHIGNAPFLEGAYMNKYKSKYYLQYAAPSTERNTYADGYYVSDSPLGPFEYSQDNPFSLKPGGFITGAGHGSTFEDEYGNWWHAATMRIGTNHAMERRIGLFPAGFDEDGVLFCNQNFADYPVEIPVGKFDPRCIVPKWMLLSYKKNVVATSEREGFPAQNLTNEDIRSFWVSKRNTAGETLVVDLEDFYEIHAIQLNFTDFEISFPEREPSLYNVKKNATRYINTETGRIRYLLEGSSDQKTWTVLKDKQEISDSLPNELILLNSTEKYRYVKLTLIEVPYNQNFAMSDVRIFGLSEGDKPKLPEFTVKKNSETSITLKWNRVEDAVGYNIRYGTSQNKLYNSWLLYDQDELTLNGLNAGVKYYIAIDSFNVNGITNGVPKPAY